MELREYINSVGPMPIASQELLETAFREVSRPKGSCLMYEYSKSYKAYVIKRGLAHAYAMKNGKAVTFWIGKDGDVVYPGQTMYYRGGEYGTVELLEDCDLYELDLSELSELYRRDIHLANWGRRAAERECIALERIILSRQFKTSFERYEELLSSFPEIVRRVPLHIIASYLNTSQENLSRIRRKTR
ncbi:MAG: Crp/Fnr family transcriptional regulator [Muribaculaceae bacterium]